MPPYPIECQTPGCGARATHKVASVWSDGTTSELKTYALCCRNCLAAWHEQAREKQRTCRLTVGETLEPPQIVELRTLA